MSEAEIIFNDENFHSVIRQSINAIQQKGLFSLEDAVRVSEALKDLENKENLTLLINAMSLAQAKSPFTFKDSFIIHQFLVKYAKKIEEKKDEPKIEEVSN